jgi:Fe-S-cluster-containing dehydrogenase component
MSVAILVDVTRCTGCERCAVACGEAHGHDPAVAERDRATTPDGLSASRWCTVMEAAEGRFARKSCMHCLEPSCVSACLVGGLQKTPQGPVVYDAEKCIGCRYCMLACPFHVPRYEWAQVAPFMRKCDLCVERLAKGQRPACVEACPHDVLTFGSREQLLERAWSLIRNTPGRYLSHVWGETELGGTSVVYISDVDLAALGWPEVDAAAIPALTEPVIEKTPLLGGTVLVGVWGLSAIIERRRKLMGAKVPNGPATSSRSEEDEPGD